MHPQQALHRSEPEQLAMPSMLRSLLVAALLVCAAAQNGQVQQARHLQGGVPLARPGAASGDAVQAVTPMPRAPPRLADFYSSAAYPLAARSTARPRRRSSSSSRRAPMPAPCRWGGGSPAPCLVFGGGVRGWRPGLPAETRTRRFSRSLRRWPRRRRTTQTRSRSRTTAPAGCRARRWPQSRRMSRSRSS